MPVLCSRRMRQNLLDTQGPFLEMKKLLVPFRVEAIFHHNVFRRFLDKGNIRNGAFDATCKIWKD